MQVVIDIPKKLYDRYKEKDHIKKCDIVEFDKALDNCIILPKGHGRLIDADSLPLHAIDDANYGSNYIRIAPTIVEADKQTSGCSSCSRSGSIIDGYVDCPDAYTEQSQYCGLNNRG